MADITAQEGVFAGLAALIAAGFTQLLNHLYKTTKAKQEHDKDQDDRVIKGYELTIAKLDARITALEAELKTTRLELRAVRQEHAECLRVQAELYTKIAILDTKVNKSIENIETSRFAKVNPDAK